MVFTSFSFLGLFLPLFLASYYLTPTRWKNLHIVLFTLAFYAVDAGVFTGVFVLSMVLNYGAGILVNRTEGSVRRAWVTAAITANLVLLGWFKYAGFAIQTTNGLASWLGVPLLPALHVVLPIGISFFTFQGIAYVMDVHRRTHEPARTFPEFAVFTACFPHLIAGPIVRFQDIAAAIRNRVATPGDFFHGFSRLAWGLFRKLVFADSLGAVADSCFGLPLTERPAPLAWLGLVCYTLQIYHDFAGYSDMAIGMGQMMGFTFPENFNQPYRSQSITEFWRRWHLSLSTWFRDYVYIPLGGNRLGQGRTYLNLFVVFFVCGLWHGAAWGFVVWGLYHGLLLAAERLCLDRLGFRPSGIAGWVYATLAAMTGWVFFRATSTAQAFDYLLSLLPHPVDKSILQASYYLTVDRVVVLIAAVATAIVPLSLLGKRPPLLQHLLTGSLATAGYIYALAVLATNGFNPFIYFRF